MTKKEAIKESIAHWKRMIEWAKKQDANERTDKDKMLNEINERYDGIDCSLCNKYDGECSKCPLGEINPCESHGSRFYHIYIAKTWGEWVINAKEMLKVLRGLK